MFVVILQILFLLVVFLSIIYNMIFPDFIIFYQEFIWCFSIISVPIFLSVVTNRTSNVNIKIKLFTITPKEFKLIVMNPSNLEPLDGVEFDAEVLCIPKRVVLPELSTFNILLSTMLAQPLLEGVNFILTNK